MTFLSWQSKLAQYLTWYSTALTIQSAKIQVPWPTSQKAGCFSKCIFFLRLLLLILSVRFRVGGTLFLLTGLWKCRKTCKKHVISFWRDVTYLIGITHIKAHISKWACVVNVSSKSLMVCCFSKIKIYVCANTACLAFYGIFFINSSIIVAWQLKCVRILMLTAMQFYSELKGKTKCKTTILIHFVNAARWRGKYVFLMVFKFNR